MIVYYVMTKYHLICALLHKLMEESNKSASLFIYSGMREIEAIKPKLEQSGIFDSIYVIDEISMRAGWNSVSSESDFKAIESNVKKLVDNLDAWLPVDLKTAERIYIANDHWAIGLYCIFNKIKYYYFEDGVGMLSKPNYSYELVLRQNKSHAYIAKALNAFGMNEYVILKYADLDNQSEGYTDRKAMHFSVRSRLQQISGDYRENILDIFDAPRIHIDDDKTTILFTEHFINMKRASIEQQKELYSYIVDYFGEGLPLLVKRHPNDIHTNYNDLFPQCIMLPRELPSELIPFCIDKPMNIGVAACSTAVLGLQDYLNKVIRFNIDIEKTYVKFHKYYVISKLCHFLDITNARLVGVDAAMAMHFGLPLDDISSKIVIVDGNDKLTKKEGETFILSNLECLNLNLALIQTIRDAALAVRIRKVINEQSTCLNTNTEFIFIYGKLVETSKLKEFREMKRLEYSGIDLDIEVISDNEKIKNIFLEGYVRSLEENIRNYQEREHELLEQVSRLKEEN